MPTEPHDPAAGAEPYRPAAGGVAYTQPEAVGAGASGATYAQPDAMGTGEGAGAGSEAEADVYNVMGHNGEVGGDYGMVQVSEYGYVNSEL